MHKTDLPNFLTSQALTDVGRSREENQDNFLVYNGEFSFFAVADGMGGVGGGATASKMAVSLLEEKLKAFVKLNPLALVSALVEINSAIFDIGQKDEQLSGMGTTLCALAFQEHELLVLNIGDSRSYRIRSGNISQLTRDHTLANELYQSGSITTDKVDNHPSSHMLTRSLGPLDTIDPDCWWHRTSLMPKDRFLICSDGLYNMVSEKEIIGILESNKSIEKACKKLIDLANENGGKDNITVVIIEVSDKYKPLSSTNESDSLNDTIKLKQSEINQIKSNRTLKILVLMLIVVCFGLFYLSKNLKNKDLNNQVVASNKVTETSSVDDFFKSIEQQADNISSKEDTPRVQNFLQRMNELEFLILRYKRILKVFEGVKNKKISSSDVDKKIKEIKLKLNDSQTSLGKLKIEIEGEASKLAKWYSYKNQNNNNLFIKLGRELSISNQDIRGLKEKYEDSSWKYLSKLEKLRNTKDEAKLKELEVLVKKREESLEKLIDKIKVKIEQEIQVLNENISKLTIKKYDLQENSSYLLKEFQDLELAKFPKKSEFQKRSEEIKAKISELEKEKEALSKYLN